MSIHFSVEKVCGSSHFPLADGGRVSLEAQGISRERKNRVFCGTCSTSSTTTQINLIFS